MKHSILIGFLTGLAVLVYLNSENHPDERSDPALSESVRPEEASGKESKTEGALKETETSPVGFVQPSEEQAQISEDLSNEISKVKRAIPTISELRNLSEEEVHGTPAKIIEAGAALGELEEYLERRPEEFVGASRFFSECATGSDLPPSVRAMCLHSLRNNPTQWAPGISAKLEGIPSEVVELEGQL